MVARLVRPQWFWRAVIAHTLVQPNGSPGCVPRQTYVGSGDCPEFAGFSVVLLGTDHLKPRELRRGRSPRAATRGSKPRSGFAAALLLQFLALVVSGSAVAAIDNVVCRIVVVVTAVQQVVASASAQQIWPGETA